MIGRHVRFETHLHLEQSNAAGEVALHLQSHGAPTECPEQVSANLGPLGSELVRPSQELEDLIGPVAQAIAHRGEVVVQIGVLCPFGHGRPVVTLGRSPVTARHGLARLLARLVRDAPMSYVHLGPLALRYRVSTHRPQGALLRLLASVA
jgi:hypothetical protein